MRWKWAAAAVAAWIAVSPAYGEDEYRAEVMSVQGAAEVINHQGARRPLAQGDLVQAGDTIATDAAGEVDLAYDGDWQNVTRIGPGSKVVIESIFPIALTMDEGSVYAKLDGLPPDSTFEIETPLAVAAVRGSAYHTMHGSTEGTRVFNFSESPVYVFGMDENAELFEEPAVLGSGETTGVSRIGLKALPPRAMSEAETAQVGEFRSRFEKRLSDVRALGKPGRIQNLARIRNEANQQLKGPLDRVQKSPTGEISNRLDESAMRRSENIRRGKLRRRPKPPLPPEPPPYK